MKKIILIVSIVLLMNNAFSIELFTPIQTGGSLAGVGDGGGFQKSGIPRPDIPTIGTLISIPNSDALKNLQINDIITTGFTTITITVRKQYDNDNVTLIGTTESGDGIAVITIDANGAIASINMGGTNTYTIEQHQGYEILYTPSENEVFETLPTSGVDDAIFPEIPDALSNNVAEQKKSQVIAEITDLSDTSITTIDIMVFYDLNFSEASGGEEGSLSRLRNIIDTGNQYFARSGIYIRLRLVYSVLKQLNPLYQGSYVLNKDVLQGLQRSSNDAYDFRNVPALRNQYKADLVSFVRQSSRIDSNCGVAYITGTNGQMDNSWRNVAFSVAMNGKSSSGIRSYECPPWSFAHEIGHNLGSPHDRDNNRIGNGGDRNPVFPYSYGYGNSDVSYQFGTIMSYVSKDKQVYKFSNPDINCNLPQVRDGILPCGRVAYANNARGFNAVRNDVAGFDTDRSGNSNIQALADTSDCFIATAAYGSYFAPKVKILRQFRDEKMLTNSFGRFLVAQYYQYSPPVADYIKDKEWLRSLARAILTPIVYFVENIYIFYITLILMLIFIFRKKLILNKGF